MMVTIMNYAVNYYNLPSNPCGKAGKMGKRTRSLKFWTLDQYRLFLQQVDDITARTALQVLFYSGVRFGELMALTLGDLNFETNTISITKTLIHKTNGDIVNSPKTDNGIRDVVM